MYNLLIADDEELERRAIKSIILRALKKPLIFMKLKMAEKQLK